MSGSNVPSTGEDPLRALIQRRLDQIAAATGHRPSVRQAADKCGMTPSRFNHHFGPRRRTRQELSQTDIEAVAAGLGIPVIELQRAAIVAAGYVIDVRRFDISVIASVLPADTSPVERVTQQARADRLAAERAAQGEGEIGRSNGTASADC